MHLPGQTVELPRPLSAWGRCKEGEQRKKEGRHSG